MDVPSEIERESEIEIIDLFTSGDVTRIDAHLREVENLKSTTDILKYRYTGVRYGIRAACRHGHLPTIELILSTIQRWNQTPSHRDMCAKIYRHDEIRSYVTGLTLINMILNEMFSFACYGGNMPAIELIVEFIHRFDIHAIIKWNWGLERACRGGHLDVVKWCLSRLKNKDKFSSLKHAMGSACSHGHMAVVEFMIDTIINLCRDDKDREKTWNFGLAYACKDGQVPIIDRMMKIFNTHDTLNIDVKMCLRYACRGGHLHVIERMSQLIPSDHELMIDCWKAGLRDAIRGGHLPAIELILQLLEEHDILRAIEWKHIFSWACGTGNLPIIEILADLIGRTDQGDLRLWMWGLRSACRKDGKMETVEYILNIIDRMSERAAINWGEVLISSCNQNNIQLIEFALQRMDERQQPKRRYLQDGLVEACGAGHIPVVEYISQCLLDSNEPNSSEFFDWNYGLRKACKFNRVPMIDHMLQKIEAMPDCEIDLYGALSSACACTNLNTVKRFIHLIDESGKYFANNLNEALHVATSRCTPLNANIIQFILDTIDTDDNYSANNWETCFSNICYRGSIPTIKLIWGTDEKMRKRPINTWSDGLRVACRQSSPRYISFVKYLLQMIYENNKLGTIKWDWVMNRIENLQFFDLLDGYRNGAMVKGAR